MSNCIKKTFPYTLMAIIGGMIISEAFGQYCIKKSKNPEYRHYFALGILSYSMVCTLLYCGYDHKPMGVVNALFNSGSIITVMFIGLYFYHEEMYFYDYLGIIFILLGVFLIFKYGH